MRPPPLAAALLAAALPAGAAAEGRDQGTYLALGAGLSFAAAAGVAGHGGSAAAPAVDATVKLKRGYAASAAVGYALGNGVRVEGEVGYRANDLRTLDVRRPGTLATLGVPAGAKLPVDGHISALTFMANAAYDFDAAGGFSPYLAGGIGLAHLSVKASFGTIGLVDDQDTVFAYAVGGGVGREIEGSGERPAVLSLDYRYFATSKPTFVGSVTGTKFDSEHRGHYFGLGLRFGF